MPTSNSNLPRERAPQITGATKTLEAAFADALSIYDVAQGRAGAGCELLGLQPGADVLAGATWERYHKLVDSIDCTTARRSDGTVNPWVFAHHRKLLNESFGGPTWEKFLRCSLSTHPFMGRGRIAAVMLAHKDAVLRKIGVPKSPADPSSRAARSARWAAIVAATAAAPSAAVPAAKSPAPKTPVTDEKAALIEKYRLRGLSEPLARAAAAFAQEGKPAAKKAAPIS